MWELDYKESWAPNDWCFWTVVLEKTLENPLDCKEIQPVHPKGNSPEYSLGGLMLKLKLRYFDHLMQTANSLERPWCLERLKGGGEGDDRGWDGWMASLTQWTWVWASPGRWWRTGKLGLLQSMGSQRVGHDWVTEQPSPSQGLRPKPWPVRRWELHVLLFCHLDHWYQKLILSSYLKIVSLCGKSYPISDSSTQADLFYFPINCVFAFGIKLSTLGSSNWLVVTQRSIKKKKMLVAVGRK